MTHKFHRPIASASEAKCVSKTRYVSKRIANIRAGQIRAKRGIALYVYHCPHCKDWRLTRRPQPDNVLDDFEVVK